ncbi:DNA-directed RNA polymerase subunit beta' [bacterium I07]|nr:DNA-directed RNA polymerase subunit beta' [bacterium I07]
MPLAHEVIEDKQFSSIALNLASPDTILSWSHGEVLKPETVNYRSYKPEKDGLFCEKIFGPVKDYECHCGKYKRIRYKGIICDRCGVEVTTKSVRRVRMGHITLAVPVVHIWYFRSIPSKIGYILGLSTSDLEKVIYYESYAVIEPGDTGLKPMQLISEEEYLEVREAIQERESQKGEADEDEEELRPFMAKMGGEAIRELLHRVKIEELSRELRTHVKAETSAQMKRDSLKRLGVIEAFRRTDSGKPNKPEWMVMSVVPVIPPELRPLVPLEGGRFATSDLNDLYRRVIIRNNRLKKLLEIRAPEVILRNEKRMLQEAVDSLFNNGKRRAAVRGEGNRPLKSLSDMLKGKQGRFRQNLLGKRIDYSGRSVIVVGPELKMDECGLPKEMALELFKPFIVRQLVERGIVKTVKSAKKLVERKDDEVWDILEEIITDHPILLNRAPTLHRLGIQAFQPILVEGKAISIHPLVCAAFNADFDGDQMAVHVPLSVEAQLESKMLMLSSHSILSPANGRPLAIPSQDIVLGCYYLTKTRKGDVYKGAAFADKEEVLIAYNDERIGLHSRVKVRIEGKIIETTTGRVIFNEVVPDELGFLNELLTKKRVESIVAQSYKLAGSRRTVIFLDNLKEMGFYYAMKAGVTIGINDVIIPAEKPALLTSSNKEVDHIRSLYEKGVITDGERYNKVIDVWTRTTNEVAEHLFDHLQHDSGGFNSVYMMADSGARGSREQIRQLAGMRGLMAKPQKKLTGGTGEIIESPITANFREGLSVLEYFISTHGARKGLADTALKTADAGYLTRRLVDVANDVVITMDDCGTIMGLHVGDLKEGEEIIEPLADRILGRVTSEDVYDPESGEVLVDAGRLIDEETDDLIISKGIETVGIRSVLTCEAKRGVCAQCYGRNLATGKPVELGEAVGVMAAQSIGEPGTQLTLRTFHIGGTASRIAAESEVVSKGKGTVQFENVHLIEGVNQESIALRRNGQMKVVDEDNRVISRFTIPYGAHLLSQDGETVKKGQVLFRWDPYSDTILANTEGSVKFVDIKENETYREEVDEATGQRQMVVIESKNRDLSPHIIVQDKAGKKMGSYIIPTRAHLMVKDGDAVEAGNVLVKIPKDISKTRDITGGLPRVAELFEARRPRGPAVVSEIDGTVKFGAVKRGVRKVVVTSEDGRDKRSYLIPYGKHLLVHEGDRVLAGEKLSEGSVVPHDILAILGANKVQEYLVNEIQEVYRLQGVRINDKHIEVIVRQMLRKVRVEDPGDTEFLENDELDRRVFLEANDAVLNKVVVEDPGDSKYLEGEVVEKVEMGLTNEKLEQDGKNTITFRQAKPATFHPLLLGITKAALGTDSFFSAASFQETTRVLTNAAIKGRVDSLSGLKENVIIGHLIPAGTGVRRFRDMRVWAEEDEEVSSEVQKDEKQKEEVPESDSG